MTVRQAETTAALEQILCQRIGEPRFQLWFAGKTKFTWNDDHLLVGVPNHFFQEWLAKTFCLDLSAATQELLGKPLPVRFALDAELFRDARRREQAPTPAVEVSPSAAAPAKKSSHPAAGRRWRRLADFVVGPCNRVAYASAQCLLDGSGHVPAPLVLHGPVGVGKTHLLEALYQGLKEQRHDARILLVTAEEFTNRFVQAMRLGKLPAFRKQFRDCDALLVDDVGFFAKKAATQEEFLHTLDVLVREGRPVVLTCDAHPRLADQLLPELIDRLLGGSVWSLDLPDTDTRRELVKTKALALGKDWPAEVLDCIARELRGNVRELEGALHTVQHYSRVTGEPITLALARQALAEVLRHSVKIVQLADIERCVCQVLGLAGNALQSKERGWMVSHPRMMAMYLARKHAGATYQEIGQRLGGRNHSTAVAAEKKVRLWLKDNTSLQLGERQLRVRDVIERIERELLR